MGAPLKDYGQSWQEGETPRPAPLGFVDAPSACFRLHPTLAATSRGFLRLLATTPTGAERLCIVPAFEGTALTVLAPDLRSALRHHPDEAAVERVGRLGRLGCALRAFDPAYAKAALRFENPVVYPAGERSAVRKYRKLIKFARTSGMAFDGEAMRRHPELALGFAGMVAARRDTPERLAPSTAVVLHLHYVDLWPEFAALLMSWRARFQLFVTLTREDAGLARRIAAEFPSARVDVVENKGRDIRPFLQLLESGALDAFELVCKVHGKRSLRQGASPLFGEMFRRASLLDLIGDDKRVQEIQNRFVAEPRLGLIGPERFRARSRHGDPAEVMGASRATIEALAQRLGAEINRAEFDVFHGTMFWARPKALAKLSALGLAVNAFSAEAGREDGAMEHAVEGVFNLAVRAAGYKVAGTSF